MDFLFVLLEWFHAVCKTLNSYFLYIKFIGLPATVTSILSLLARRLSKKMVYLKRLDICEALGQVNIIASDKTGTLTKNSMTVTDLWHWNKFVHGKHFVLMSKIIDKNRSLTF